jgi:hypothetical protein
MAMLFRQVRMTLCSLFIALTSSSHSLRMDRPSCLSSEISVALLETREMAANAHDQLQQSLDGRISGNEDTRISLN